MMAALKEFVSHNTQFNRVHVNIYQMNYKIISKPLINNLFYVNTKYAYIYVYIYHG